MSDGMGREPAYLSSHATNRYFIPNWGKGRAFFLYDQILFLQMWEGKRGTNDGHPVSKRKSPCLPRGAEAGGGGIVALMRRYATSGRKSC